MGRHQSNTNIHRLYDSPLPPSHKDLSSGCLFDTVNLRHLRCNDRAFLVSLLEKAVAAAEKAGLEMRYNLNASIVPDESWTTSIMGTPFGPVRLQLRKKPEPETGEG